MSQFTPIGGRSENINISIIKRKDTSKHISHHNDVDSSINELSKNSFGTTIGKILDDLTSFAQAFGTNFEVVPVAVTAFAVFSI